MKQTTYLFIFRMTWLSIGINLILIFTHYNINNVIMMIISFMVGGIFAIIRLDDNNYIADTERLL